ncbi:MAG: P1 family peptidase, partial [Proteobacteria bacterium]|nr:P1 family peptidase [Pseudomonadota bacterium]
IVFDLLNGGRKDWAANPYPGLGARALAAAAAAFAIGAAGAGRGALARGLKGGLGSASCILDNGLTVGALVVVNSLGAVTVGEGPHFWAAPWELDGEFGGLGPAPRHQPRAEPAPSKAAGEATTIAIVATDAALTKAQAQRLATAAHAGLSRAIVPSQTLLDGDLVFAVSTGARPIGDRVAGEFALGHAAAACLSRAIARAVHAAKAEPGDLLPAWRARFGQE